MWPMQDKAWDDYPKLKIIAEGFLDEEERIHLLGVIVNPLIPKCDEWRLSDAFYWGDTLEGHAYWGAIDVRVNGLVPLQELYAILEERINADDIPEPTGW